MIRNIIFDMDGTLADTAKATVKAISRIAPKYQLPQLSVETIKSAIGYANPEFYHILYPSYPKDIVNEFGKEVEEAEKGIINSLGEEILFDGVVPMLHKLKQDGHKLYLASTGSTEHVEIVLKSSNIYSLFDEIHCDEPEKIQMVRAIINNLPKKLFCMVGDKTKDSIAAKGNKILSIGAGFGYCSREDYGSFDKIIQSWDELFLYIEGSHYVS